MSNLVGIKNQPMAEQGPGGAIPQVFFRPNLVKHQVTRKTKSVKINSRGVSESFCLDFSFSVSDGCAQ